MNSQILEAIDAGLGSHLHILLSQKILLNTTSSQAILTSIHFAQVIRYVQLLAINQACS